MSELSRIANALRELGLRDDDPKRRQAGLLDVLRRELDEVPQEDLFTTLAAMRSHLVKERNTEATRLWECLTKIETTAARRPDTAATASAKSAEGSSAILRALVGEKEAGALDEREISTDRLCQVIALLVDRLGAYDQELRNVRVAMRRQLALVKSGDTISNVKGMPPLKRVIAKALAESGDIAELESRIKVALGSFNAMYQSHHRSVGAAVGELRKMIDPNELQRKHGNAVWKEYRKIYNNQLHKLGLNFIEEFCEPAFVREYLHVLSKLE